MAFEGAADYKKLWDVMVQAKESLEMIAVGHHQWERVVVAKIAWDQEDMRRHKERDQEGVETSDKGSDLGGGYTQVGQEVIEVEKSKDKRKESRMMMDS
jgi:hypothetical protein